MKKSVSENYLTDSTGSILIPMGLILLALISGTLGTTWFLRDWRKQAATQLRIDHCVGMHALRLRNMIRSIENSNERITAIRASIVAAMILSPQLITPLRAALTAQSAQQKAVILRWRASQAGWLLKQGCDSQFDWSLPLPSAPWLAVPPDVIGPRPMKWAATPNTKFKIRLMKPPRKAAAVVFKKEGSNDWKAKWASFY